jgi:hypothetical protein
MIRQTLLGIFEAILLTLLLGAILYAPLFLEPQPFQQE